MATSRSPRGLLGETDIRVPGGTLGSAPGADQSCSGIGKLADLFRPQPVEVGLADLRWAELRILHDLFHLGRRYKARSCPTHPTSGFLIMPEVVSRSDMIALIPRRIADGWSDRVQVVEPPLTIPGFTIASFWHDRTTNHPAHRWLRERLTTLAAEG